MKTIINLIWFALTGCINCIIWFTLGALWCITIVGMPFGKQCFKLGLLSMWPVGKNVESGFFTHPFLNMIWFIFGGFALTASYLISAFFWSVTVVGFPFGMQCLKLAMLASAPFGAKLK